MPERENYINLEVGKIFILETVSFSSSHNGYLGLWLQIWVSVFSEHFFRLDNLDVFNCVPIQMFDIMLCANSEEALMKNQLFVD